MKLAFRLASVLALAASWFTPGFSTTRGTHCSFLTLLPPFTHPCTDHLTEPLLTCAGMLISLFLVEIVKYALTSGIALTKIFKFSDPT